MLKRIKENKLLLIFFIFLITLSSITLGRLVYKEIKKNFFYTKNFFFESDKLREDNFLYKITNYNGVDNYEIVIHMNSFKNNKLKATSDIYYDIDFSCSKNAHCSISKESGIISKTSNKDFFIASIVPKTSLDEGESMEIDVKTKSTNPYIKELSAKFRLTVENPGLSYEIQDKKGRNYLLLKLTNTLDYYVVREAFQNYKVNDKINIKNYLNLTKDEKKKCISAIANLQFNPRKTIFDNTSNYSTEFLTKTTTIDNFKYVNEITLKIEPLSSIAIRFYKDDKTKDYTFPIVNNTSIIKVNFN